MFAESIESTLLIRPIKGGDSMTIRLCDCCGKQINRYSSDSGHVMYDVRHAVSFMDDNRKEKGYGMVHLDFCPMCYSYVESFLDGMLNDFPDEFNTTIQNGTKLDRRKNYEQSGS